MEYAIKNSACCAHMVPQVNVPTHIKKKQQFRQFKLVLCELYIHQRVYIYIFLQRPCFLPTIKNRSQFYSRIVFAKATLKKDRFREVR